MNVDDQGYGGVFAFVMNVIRNIDHDKFLLDIAAFEPFEKEGHEKTIRQYGSMVYDCQGHGNFLIKQLCTCVKFYHLLKKNKYHAIHVHSDVAYKLLLYSLIGRFAGVANVIVHSHSTGVEGRYRCLKKFLQAVSKPILSMQKSKKLACSNLAANWMYTKKCQYFVVRNGIEIEKFRYSKERYTAARKKLGISLADKVVGTVARFSFPKYPEKLLDVFYKVVSIDESFKLLWVGTGPLLEKIKLQAREYGIEDKIIFYGNTDKVEDMYQAMDVFVLTSRFEGLCIAAVEAQASGCQCICSDSLPKEVNLSSLYHTLSIEELDEVWAKEILKCISIHRYDTSNEIVQNGYDIQQTVNVLMDIYSSY